MPQEQFANDAMTTLASGVSASDTSITVTDPSTFPSAPQFRVRVGDELMIVTAITGDDDEVWAVTRGAEGTTAAAHNIGDEVTAVLTAGALYAIAAEDSVLAEITSGPASGLYTAKRKTASAAGVVSDFSPATSYATVVHPTGGTYAGGDRGELVEIPEREGYYWLFPVPAVVVNRDLFAARLTGTGSGQPRTLNGSFAWGDDGAALTNSLYPMQIDGAAPAVKPTATVLAWPSKRPGAFEYLPVQYAGLLSGTYYSGLVGTDTQYIGGAKFFDTGGGLVGQQYTVNTVSEVKFARAPNLTTSFFDVDWTYPQGGVYSKPSISPTYQHWDCVPHMVFVGEYLGSGGDNGLYFCSGTFTAHKSNPAIVAGVRRRPATVFGLPDPLDSGLWLEAGPVSVPNNGAGAGDWRTVQSGSNYFSLTSGEEDTNSGGRFFVSYEGDAIGDRNFRAWRTVNGRMTYLKQPAASEARFQRRFLPYLDLNPTDSGATLIGYADPESGETKVIWTYKTSADPTLFESSASDASPGTYPGPGITTNINIHVTDAGGFTQGHGGPFQVRITADTGSGEVTLYAREAIGPKHVARLYNIVPAGPGTHGCNITIRVRVWTVDGTLISAATPAVFGFTALSGGESFPPDGLANIPPMGVTPSDLAALGGMASAGGLS